MRLVPFLAFIVVAFTSSSINCQEVTEKPYDWQPVLGLKIAGQKAYFDQNGIETKVENEKAKINVGDILFVFNVPKEIETNKGKFIGKSVITHMIVECKSGSLAPIYDIMFDVEKPTLADKPLAGHKYEKKDMMQLSKKDPLYKTLCPEYI
jgi:hypothetical protein